MQLTSSRPARETSIAVGMPVTLLAVTGAFCGATGRIADKPAVTNLIVKRVYVCGNHWRVSADNPHATGTEQYDARETAFEEKKGCGFFRMSGDLRHTW